MKKKRLNLIKSIAPGVCLFGASAGVIFGLSAGLFKISYINLSDSDTRVASAKTYNYYDQDIKSEWNMDTDVIDLSPKQQDIDYADGGDWEKLHGADAEQLCNSDWQDKMEWKATEQITKADTLDWRAKYVSMVVDGAQHSAKDQSFNESVFQGLVDFRHNKRGLSISADDELKMVRKPAQDTNQGFQDQYLQAVRDGAKVLGLPGFPHVAPLQGLGKYNESTGLFEFNCDKAINSVAMVMYDGDFRNNQNVASILFRADQPAFLTGLATCEYFIKNLKSYHANYHDLTVGTYGGTPLHTVTIYMGGLQRGLEFFNEFILKAMLKDARGYLDNPTSFETKYGDEYKDIIQYSKYKSDLDKWSTLEGEEKNELISSDGTGLLYDEYSVKMVSLGKFDTYFTGSFAAGDAIGVTKQLLNREVSAILPVSGAQTIDTTQEVANQKTNCFVIGVDTAQENGDAQRPSAYTDETIAPDESTSSQGNQVIRFSGIKDMITVSEKITRLCMENKNWDVNANGDPTKPDPEKAICNIGFKTCGNFRNGLISISFDGLYFLLAALRHVTFLTGSDFETAWGSTAKTYCENHGISTDLDDPNATFYKNVINWEFDPTKEHSTRDTGILTFKTADADGNPTYIYENYTHVMGILSEVLNDGKMHFNKDMTVKMNIDPKKPQPEPADEAGEDGTVLEWLENNMYFIV